MIGLLMMVLVVGFVGCGKGSPTGPSIESRTETYFDGSTRAEYSFYVDKTTQEQVKHGPYVSYYQDGATQSEGAYEDGLQSGNWTEYYENGIKKEDQVYQIGQPDSTWTTYSETGDPKYIRNYFNGELVGPGGESTSEVTEEEASLQVNQFRMYIESFLTEYDYDRLSISINENLVQYLEGNINSGWTAWYDIGTDSEAQSLTFVFTSDNSDTYEGFDISRIAFGNSGSSEETTVEVEITDGAGNYSNNEELRWTVDIPPPTQKVEYQIYRDPANNSPTKHGTYESFYEDGSFYETGTYTNGHKDGLWTGFYPDGITRYKYCWSLRTDGSAGVLHGPSIDYYEDGTKSSEYQYFNGDKHGEFVEYHSNATFRLKGSYKGDNPDGLWEEWAEDGTKKSEDNYSDGIKEGYYKEYDNNGNLVIEGEYKEGRRWNGEFFINVKWEEYGDPVDGGYWELSDNGDLGRFTYSEGVWNGRSLIYYYDGNKWIEENHAAGFLDGTSVVYDEEENVISSAGYKAGKLDGKKTEYSADGTKISEYTYSEGIRDGEFVEYHSNGTVSWSGSYEDGNRDGLWEEWFSNGNKRTETTWDEEVFLHQLYYSYTDQDVLISIVEHNALGQRNGEAVFYAADGEVLSQGTYVDNLPWNGNFVDYYYDGTKKSEYQYVNGAKDGGFVEYHSSGTVSWSGSYDEDVLGGLFVYYEIDGTISREETWEDGVCLTGCIASENQFRMYIESFETEGCCDHLYVLLGDGELWIVSFSGEINSGWTDWYDIDPEAEKLTFLFVSDYSERYEGFDISRISFRDSDSGIERTVEVEITDGPGSYSNDEELRWTVNF